MDSGMIRRPFVSLSALVLATGLLAPPGCNGDDDDDSTTGTNGGAGTAEGTLEDLGERADAMAEQARAAWLQFVEDVNARLARMQPEVEQIKTSARDKADAQLDQLVAELDEKTAAARTKLAELRDNLADATEEERAELDRMLQEAGDALQRAKARLTELSDGVQPPSLSGGAGNTGGGTGAPIDD